MIARAGKRPIKGDQVFRHIAEPVPNLLLLASLLSATGAEYDLLGLA